MTANSGPVQPMKTLMMLLIALALTACAAFDAPAPNMIPSTPVSDLPAAMRAQAPLPTPVPDAIIAAADAEYLLMANLYERISPSVVNIEVVSRSDNSRFLDVNGGSGFVFDADGHIVTNAHVVKDAREIRVTFNDGYVKDARLVGLDSYSDLAVIRVQDVDAARILPLTLGDSERVRVGERAIAIGNPFGLASSMTAGIVSAVGRQLSSAALVGGTDTAPGFQNPSIIQVDADINPGNSGGPLLNSRGEVIGVNTAIRTESGVFEGVGFAVPANTVRRVIPELIASGRVDYAWLGISAQSNDDGYGVAGLAERLNLPVARGVLISAVTRQSPADKSGLRGGDRWVTVRGQDICAGGDIIVAINEAEVNSIDQLVAYLVMNNRPGDTITLRVVRGGDTFDVPVLLETRPAVSDTPNCGR